MYFHFSRIWRKIECYEGEKNSRADGLSRLPRSTMVIKSFQAEIYTLELVSNQEVSFPSGPMGFGMGSMYDKELQQYGLMPAFEARLVPLRFPKLDKQLSNHLYESHWYIESTLLNGTTFLFFM